MSPDDQDHTPFRVEFTFRTALIEPAVEKPLDAVLSWAAVMRADFNGADDPIAQQHDLPLQRHYAGEQWCFMASNIIFEWNKAAPRESVHYVKRSRLEDYADAWVDGLLSKRPAFDGARGLTKAGSYVEPTRWADRAIAYGVGNIDAIRALLPWVTHIGKLRHKDFGAVNSFTVTPDDANAKNWTRRTLPQASPEATSHVAAMKCLSAPYWNRERMVPALAFAE